MGRSIHNKGNAGGGSVGPVGPQGAQGPAGPAGGSSAVSLTLKNTSASVGDVLRISEGDTFGTATGFGLYHSSNWATKVIGARNERGTHMDVDSSGNSYICGSFSHTATFGSTTLTNTGTIGELDGFVCKLNSAGAIQWVAQAGGSETVQMLGISVDASGNIIVCGWFKGTITFGSITVVSTGTSDLFVAKLNSDGVFQWVTQTSGASAISEIGQGIDTDDAGNCYVTGYFNGTATFGTTTLSFAGGLDDIFIAKLNSAGVFQWAVSAGGTASDRGVSIAVDATGNSYITGFFNGTATFGTTTLVSAGSSDIFVAQLDPTGAWQWAVKAGGAAADQVLSIAVDSGSNCYISGIITTSGTQTAVFGSTVLTSNGAADAFIAKLNPFGTWQWAVNFGGTGSDQGLVITVDSADNVYIAGIYQSSIAIGATLLLSTNTVDLYLAKFDPSGNAQWAISSNAPVANKLITGLKVQGGSYYLTGYFVGSIVMGGVELKTSGNEDMFVYKLVDSIPGGQLVVANAAGAIGDTISTSSSGLISSFSGLTTGQLYYYNPPSKIPTTVPSPYILGYATSATTILFTPQPAFIL